MKRIYYYIIGAIALVGVTVSASWIGAVNGEVRKNEDVVEATGNVHASLSGRYEKIGAFIDAIEDANATVLDYLQTIMAARTAFANAIAAGDSAEANDQAEIVDATFVTLVAYMEDNPGSYNTVNLYAGFMAEFAASTNVVTESIRTYNGKANVYNTHIKIFPNLIFLSGKTPYAIWALTNYTSELPTFN